MKKHIALWVVAFMLVLQVAFAQVDAHLKLSKEHPAAGEKITFTYDAAGTPLAGKTPQAIVYYVDGTSYDAQDISLVADGKLQKGTLVIPATAKAFFIKLSSDKLIDNNNGNGYLYMIYKGDKPVEGAYAAKGYNYWNGGPGELLGGIKVDNDTALELYKKELELYPNNLKATVTYVAMQLKSKDEAAKNMAMQKLTDLAKSDDKGIMLSAVTLYKANRMQPKADSLSEVIKTKFPEEGAKSATMLAFSKDRDPVKREELYNAYIKQYPETTDNKTVVNNFRVMVATAYLNAGDLANYNRIAATIKDKINLAIALNNKAYQWAQKGEHLDDAAQLSRSSLDLMTQKMNAGGMSYYSASQVKSMMQGTYDGYTDTYAYILYKQGKFAEALSLQQGVMDRTKNPNAEVTEHYALYLKATGNTKKATELIEASIKNGKGTGEMTAALKEMYVKDKGSDAGYDTYFAALKDVSDQKLKTEQAKEMIDKPAPDFALKDLNGNVVSLASLKGKVVVVDFWATWCGPCKASFPGMQQAVTKFKDNPNVQFLFIDTWEKGDDYLPDVKSFIADNKYTFKVLMDEKNETGKQAKIVSAYNVEGIPTKFIIDGNGKVRFKKVGFSGTAEALVEEITSMINLAARPETATTGDKTTVPAKTAGK